MFCVNQFLIAVTNTLEKQLRRRKVLFWLMVPGDSVHGWLAVLFQGSIASSGQSIMVDGHGRANLLISWGPGIKEWPGAWAQGTLQRHTPSVPCPLISHCLLISIKLWSHERIYPLTKLALSWITSQSLDPPVGDWGFNMWGFWGTICVQPWQYGRAKLGSSYTATGKVD
jgi:hypothetical protein